MRPSLCVLVCFGLFASLCRAGDLPNLDSKTASEPFRKLRLAAAEAPDFTGMWAQDPVRRNLLKTYETDAKQFLSASGRWLQTCPVDARIHLLRARLLLKSGDLESHLFHQLMYYGLVSSIVASGDGKTAATAYKVISIDEEYTVLNHLGAKLTQQILQPPCDVMQVDLQGTPTTIYFDATIPLRVEKRLFAPKSS